MGKVILGLTISLDGFAEDIKGSVGSLYPDLDTLKETVFNLTSHILLWERFNLKLYVVEAVVFGVIILVLRITRKEDMAGYRIRESL